MKEERIPKLTREQLISRAKKQREEIQQYFDDVHLWNRTRGKIAGAIKPDPEGEMRRIAKGLDAMLVNEVPGYVPTILDSN